MWNLSLVSIHLAADLFLCIQFGILVIGTSLSRCPHGRLAVSGNQTYCIQWSSEMIGSSAAASNIIKECCLVSGLKSDLYDVCLQSLFSTCNLACCVIHKKGGLNGYMCKRGMLLLSQLNHTNSWIKIFLLEAHQTSKSLLSLWVIFGMISRSSFHLYK